jgi:hypothetical protein
MIRKLFFAVTLMSLLALEAKECTIFSVFKNAVVIDGYDFFYDADKAVFPLNICDIVDVEYEREELPDDGYRLTATVTSLETGQSQRLISPILSDKQYLKIAKIEKIHASINSLSLPTMTGGSRTRWDYRYEATLTLENGAFCTFKAMVAGLRMEEDAKRGLQATEERLKEGCYLEVVKDDSSHYPADMRGKHSEVALYTPQKELIVKGRQMGSSLKRGDADPQPIFYSQSDGCDIKLKGNALNSCVRTLQPRSFEYIYPDYIELHREQIGPGQFIGSYFHGGGLFLEYRRESDGRVSSTRVHSGIGVGAPLQYVRSYKNEEGKLIIVLKHHWRNIQIECSYCD